jgi:hypothetical protein
MAMNNDMDDFSLAEDIALYRRHAREAPTPLTDARVMRAAANAARQRHAVRYMPWLGAVAAGLVLWLGLAQPFKPMTQQPPDVARAAPPGYLEGRARLDLMQMDVRAPMTDRVSYLLQHAPRSP